MVRFRKHKYAFTTDIEKMFRMINIHPEQTCLQRILWKKGRGEPIKTYELTTVTYGTVSAPYLATRTLKQLAMDYANNFPLTAPVVLSDCYMGDILSGSESIEELIELQHQLIEMFQTAGMHLHKWCGNLPEITSNLQEYAFLESDETKALGIIWNPRPDCFLFRIEQQRSKVKRRGPLTTNEVNDSETWLIKQDQSGINLSDPSGNLKSLNIFQDDKGVLRVGGRLEKASIPYSQKHPAILAKNSKMSLESFSSLVVLCLSITLIWGKELVCLPTKM
ncbi:integrase catalytic domain-containing protein [Trichonephila clavata]|uniref:Integrase catalytic domain-containing protein n=1 Tax=Trichonephila clavata TaxID=2740835 RepID=A0A8X6H944_TRICU|nr:integrase catalytic domain-containing protein [Trichonephila clavata]